MSALGKEVTQVLRSQVSRAPQLTRSEQSFLTSLRSLPLLNAEQEVLLAKKIEAGLYAQHRLDSGTVPAGQQEAHREVARQGTAAYEQMVQANIRLSAYWARIRISTGGSGTLGFEDLVQEGVLGVVRAVCKWDFTLGVKFSTYASYWIRNYQSRAVWEALTVHVPQVVADMAALLGRVTEELRRTLRTEPSLAEVIEASGLDPALVAEILPAVSSPVRLDAAMTTEVGSATFGDLLGDPHAPDPAAIAEAVDAEDRFARRWRQLPERQQRVLRLRMGLGGNRPLSLADTARKLGVAEHRAAAAERQAVAALTR